MNLKDIWQKYLTINKRTYDYLHRVVNKYPWIALAIVLILFTALKWGSFHTDFGGYYQAKYATYLDPALSMVEHDSPLFYRVKYKVSVDNLSGIQMQLSLFPAMEWLMFLVYKYSPFESLYLNTRLLTHFLSLFVLGVAFVFFRRFFQDSFRAIVAVFLFSTNIMFLLSSFIPLLDIMLLGIAFFVFLKILKFIDTQDFSLLHFAGLVAGVGILIKYSLLLWLVPLVLIWLGLAMKTKGIEKVLLSFATFLIPIVLTIFSFRYSFRYIVAEFFSERMFYFILFGIWALIFVGIIIIFAKYQKWLLAIIRWGLKSRTRIALTMLIVLGGGFVFSNILLGGGFQHFLSTSKLLFSLAVYKTILAQLIFDVHWFFIGLAGIGLFLTKYKGENKFIVSATVAILIFFLTALMSVYFHAYYRLPVLIVLGVLASRSFAVLAPRGWLLIFFLSFCFLWFNVSKVGRPILATSISGMEEAITYLTQNTEEDELFVDGHINVGLAVVSRRRRIHAWELDQKKIREQIKQVGLAKTMSSLGIKYFISNKSIFDLYPFANLFSEIPLENYNERRIPEEIILNSANNFDRPPFKDMALRNKVIAENKINEKLFLEKQIGEYYFITFKE